MLAFLLRRLAQGALVLVAVSAIAFSIPRLAQPEHFAGEAYLSGLAGDLGGLLVHLDLGRACGLPGCPEVRAVLGRGAIVDLYLLAGAMVIGVAAGIAGGVLCAARRRSTLSRGMELLATVAYSTPVYVLGLGLLLLFEPSFGVLPLPVFFEPNRYAPLLEDPWAWLQSMLVPWLVLAAPLGAVCLRLTVATLAGELEEPYVQTARAKGLARRRVLRRHVAPAAYPANAALVGAWAPFVVSNMILVEFVFSLPGTFRFLERGSQTATDLVLLQGLAVWSALLVVVLGLISDLVLYRADPRVRAAAIA